MCSQGWGRERQRGLGERDSEKVIVQRPELCRHKPMGTKASPEPMKPGRDKDPLNPKASGRPEDLPVLRP